MPFLAQKVTLKKSPQEGVTGEKPKEASGGVGGYLERDDCSFIERELREKISERNLG